MATSPSDRSGGPRTGSGKPEDALPTGPREAWLLLPPGEVPARWRRRGIPLVAVPLLPGEATQALGRATPEIDPTDEPLVRLVAGGMAGREIARQLEVPLRTVERRLARLRRRFDVKTTAELVAFLAGKGF